MGASTFYFAFIAVINSIGLIFNGLIDFSTSEDIVFNWFCAAILAYFGHYSVLLFFVGLFSSQRVILTSTEIHAPISVLSKDTTSIRLAKITGLRVQSVQQDRSLHISHNGEELIIEESYMPSAAKFDELCAALASRLSPTAQVLKVPPLGFLVAIGRLLGRICARCDRSLRSLRARRAPSCHSGRS